MKDEYKKDRRKKIFRIVPGEMRLIQMKFFKLMILTLCISLIVMTSGFYWVIHLILNTAELGRYAETQIKYIGYWANGLFVMVMAASLLFGAILSFHLSQKMAGPLYRIENALKAMLDGKAVTSIKTRPKDEFKNLIDLFNKFIEKAQK